MFAPTYSAAWGRAVGVGGARVYNPGAVAGAGAWGPHDPGPGLLEVISSVWDTPVEGHRRALAKGTSGDYGS